MKNIFIAVVFGIIFTQSAFSGGGGGGGDEHYGCRATDCTNVDTWLGSQEGCTAVTTNCYRDNDDTTTVGVQSCSSCINGKPTSPINIYIDICDENVTYDACDCSGTCNNCEDSNWGSGGYGYEQKTYATCDCGKCNTRTVYRCAAGFYGSGTSCSPCPGGGNSAAGSTSQTDCYITGSFSDSTGSGTYTGSCYYSN